MIEETGRVTAVDGQWALVTTERHGSCANCTNGGGCSTALTMRMLQPSQVQLRVLNSIGANPGEQVIIGVAENSFLRATAMLYGVPLLALLAGTMAGQWLSLHWVVGNTDLLSLLGGMLGLVAGLGYIWYLTLHDHPHVICRTEILRQSVSL